MALEGKTIFITGGAGFIGSHLCERLADRNRIVIFDNEHRNAIRHTRLLSHPNVVFTKGDVLDAESVMAAMRGSEVVIHCAAIAGIDSVIKKPIVTMKINLFGTYNVLEAAVAHGVQRFIGFSTSEVYGPYTYKGTEQSLTTQGEVGKMRWTYAVSKLGAEHLAHCYHEEFQLPVTTIRPFNVYGPRQVGEGAIQKFILQSCLGEDIVVYGDGTQIRAWCYIDDFVDGVLLTLESPKAIGRVFNIGNPQGTITILELAQKIIRLNSKRSRIVFRESVGPDVEVRVPSVKLAAELLGYAPRIGLEEGIEQTIAWFRDALQGERGT